MSQFYLYRHIRPDTNQVFYVGIGSIPKRNVTTFETEHSRAFDVSKWKRSEYWQRVFTKCNKQIEIDILYESSSYDEIKEKEKEFIKLYGRHDLQKGSLVNLTDGGDGNVGLKHSESTRKKMSESAKGKHTPSEETKLKISLSKTGKPGHKHTEEHKKRMSLMSKVWRTGTKASEATKKKLSEARKGNKNALGYKHTQEAKTNMSIADRQWRNKKSGQLNLGL